MAWDGKTKTRLTLPVVPQPRHPIFSPSVCLFLSASEEYSSCEARPPEGIGEGLKGPGKPRVNPLLPWFFNIETHVENHGKWFP